MAELYLTQGDLTRMPRQVDAIVTLINSGGMWFGGVDGAIMRVAGGTYHSQAQQVLSTAGLRNGQAVVAKGRGAHRGTFRDVVFVVDDRESPLNELVYTALIVAEDQLYRTVALPLMRTGVMAGVVEKSVTEVVQQMRQGIDRFKADRSGSQMDIYVVVFDDPKAVHMLSQNMRLLS